MVTIHLKDGRIRTSRNLRGIMDHARRCNGATKLRQDCRTLHVNFPDGAFCYTTFADSNVLIGWIVDRVRYGRGKFELSDQR